MYHQLSPSEILLALEVVGPPGGRLTCLATSGPWFLLENLGKKYVFVIITVYTCV